MKRLRAAMAGWLRRLRPAATARSRARRAARRRGDAGSWVGRDLADDPPHPRKPVWLIPGIVVGLVFAALAIAHVRVELIGQGYKRYRAVERLQALEEEKRILTAQVRELRDPARLAELAGEMGLSRPDRVIALAPPGDGPRP